MNAKISFVTSETTQSVVKAVGALMKGGQVTPCPLSVGDVISDPSAPRMYFQIVGRQFHVGTAKSPGTWFLYVKQAEDPESFLGEVPEPQQE